ncbi:MULTISPECIES: dienelactone hydrolase family protein [unclassified Chelatococcus]|uniref:alpha/beta hydrolase n=1 Tax=unclassified Chelatococcus TaxID=2638111 RepID=UPI001BCA9928|nr:MULTISPECIES: dienelactone hydrolase family protein [unclassified Chelatococcus]MBS7701127.1 dienelactone hydrolase family protein [Chelatococcus sp. YT9]MBX3557258.1 dienelactone hydrolase family protein [Chelatococcus sp.]
MTDSLVILLHGVGARGTDLDPLRDALRAHLPNTQFVAPDAPDPFDRGKPLRQWFSTTGVTVVNRPQRVAAARAGFDAIINDIVDVQGLKNRLDRVAFVGFSQGAIMALDAAASGRWRVAATVAFAGRLASPPPLSPAGARILLVHGAADTVIPAAESEEAFSRLHAAGADVSFETLPDVGHFVSPDGIALAGAYLARIFKANTAAMQV